MSTLVTDRTVTVQQVARPEKPSAVIHGLGNVTSTYTIVGSCPTNCLKLTISGLSLRTSSPAVVLLQPRQGENQDFGYPDEFAVQLITTAADSLQVLIKRLDSGSGWGQNLRLDILIFDGVNDF
jgi:hypothetical protein